MAKTHETDVIETGAGDLEITFLGHGTLMFTWQGKHIHVDPYSQVADYAALPKADLVLITHEHGDHLDPRALRKIRKPDTVMIYTAACAEQLEGGTVMRPGDRENFDGVIIEAVPAYNMVHKRPSGEPFHPRGPRQGNGYVLTFADVRVYVAGDTENTPEMKDLKDIDIAFLPMNLPYTMTPEMVADAAKAFRPSVVYPYHYGSTDPQELVDLLADEDGIEVRIRDLA
ncbi:MAG: MBL fold metallo-hydrolase [Anaerolineae bacterium]